MTKLNGMKIAIMQVTCFLNGPIFNCHFIALLFYIERKWLPMRNLTIIFPLKSNFSVSMLLIKLSKHWKIAEFPKISIEMKNRKTIYKAQTASRLKSFFSLSPSFIPPDKILLRLWNKDIQKYTVICFQSSSRK